MSDNFEVTTPNERWRALVAADGIGPSEPPIDLRYRRRVHPLRSLRALWQAGPIIRTLTERNLRVRYKQSLLGFAWAILTPLALLVVLTIVFEYGAGLQSPGASYPLFAFIGLIPWTFFSSAISSGGVSILADKALLNKCRFPREVFPLSAVVVAGVDALMSLVPLAGLFAWERQWPAATSALAVVPLLVLLLFTSGLAMVVSSAVVYFRDVRLLLPLALQVGLFASPVAWDLELVPERLRLVYCALNPVAPVIDGLRSTVLLGHPPEWAELAAGAATAGLLAVVGYWFFKKVEGGFADVA